MKETITLQQQAYNYLIEAIKSGKLKTDVIYSLNQMSQEIGISKTPFRDAVLRLEQERYVDILPSKGFMVHKMTEQDIMETYQMREAIEFFCIKQLSSNMNTERGKLYYEKLVGKVKSQIEIMATSKDCEEFARKDYEFHRSLVQYVGNETMLEIYRQFMYRIFWFIVTSFNKAGRMEETVKEHQFMLDMIEKQDFSHLETLLSEHLETAKEINMKLLY